MSDQDIRSVLSGFGLDVSEDLLNSAIDLANGSVRKTLQLVNGNVVSDFNAYKTMVESGSVKSSRDWSAIIAIVDRLTSKGNEETFRLFYELTTNWIEDRVRNQAGKASLSSLAAFGQLWEKTRESISVAEAYNLDRKQVILTLTQRLFKMNAEL